MREFVFRVWDKNIEEMGEVTELKYSKTQYNLVKYRYVDEKGRLIDEQTHFDKGYSGGVILMQYTGRKDINNRKIYGRDIVKVTHRNDRDAVGVGTVLMIRGAWTILEGGYARPLFDDDVELEVIGNIYEDPELLEVEE